METPRQEPQQEPCTAIAERLSRLAEAPDYRTAWASFDDTISLCARTIGAREILEIGGGRAPLLQPEMLQRLGARYTVNDVSPEELRRAPAWVSTLPGDISDEATARQSDLRGRIDLLFSRMVFEHLASPAAAYANAHALLREGGVLLNFIPTLYCPPFVVNACLPDRLARALLRAVLPDPSPERAPKFPAYYRWCTSTESTARRIRGIGFRSVQIQPFFGHGYYERIPLLRDLSRRTAAWCAHHDWRPLSSYAYIVAVK